MSNQTTNKKLIAIVGPTGSGKTALATALAKKFNGVLVSADSRQVYRGLDIGTNKEGNPGIWQGQPARLIDEVPQLLIDIVEPGGRFTLNDWLAAAQATLVSVWTAGKLPIVVGGTGLYVTALLEGYQPGGGRGATNRQTVDFDSLTLQPDVGRDILYQKSDERFERIFEALIKETQGLLEGGVSQEWLEKIGLDYRFASYFLHRRMNRELAIAEFQQASRHYIRRQLTWWRHHNSPFLVKTIEEAQEKTAQFIEVPPAAGL